MKEFKKWIRLGLAAILLIGYCLAYFALRGIIAVRVWNTNTSGELGLVFLFMCLFVVVGFLFFKPASRMGRLALYLCTGITGAAALMVIALTVLPGGGHPSLGSIVYGLFGVMCLFTVPLGLILFTFAFLFGEKLLFFGAGLIYFFSISLYAFPIVGIDVPSCADRLFGTKVFSRTARHLDRRCPDYDELGQDITLLCKCRELSERRRYVLSTLAGRHPQHRGAVVKEIQSQFANTTDERTKVEALNLLKAVHYELIPTAEINADSVKFLHSNFNAPESRVRETAFELLLERLEVIASRPEYDTVIRDLVRIYGEEQQASKFYFFLDRAADELEQWPIGDAARRHAVTNLHLFVTAVQATNSNKRYVQQTLARLETLQSIDGLYGRGGYKFVYDDCLKRAERGDAAAMVWIGLMFQRGEGIERDYRKAMDWYVKAFEKNDLDAYIYIAALYRDGLGVSRDLDLACALHWIANRSRFGSFAAKRRQNQGMSELMRLMPEAQVQECRKISEAYVNVYVEKRGNLNDEEQGLKFTN